MSSKLIQPIVSSSEYTMFTVRYIFWSALSFNILTTIKHLNINRVGLRKISLICGGLKYTVYIMLGPEQSTNLSRFQCPTEREMLVPEQFFFISRAICIEIMHSYQSCRKNILHDSASQVSLNQKIFSFY